MNRFLLVAMMGVASATVVAQGSKSVKAAKKPVTKSATVVPVFKNNSDSVSYAVGVRIMQSLKQQGFNNVNMALLTKALSDASQNKPALNEAAIMQCMSTFQQKATAVRQAEQEKVNSVAAALGHQQGQKFLAENAKRPGVVSLPSGIQYEVLKASADNTHPKITSTVTCHYTGTLLDGTKFDSSVDRGQPASFPLANVIAGWQEALQLMTVGSKWRIWIPSNLAYGDVSNGQIPAGSTLAFDVELLKVD